MFTPAVELVRSKLGAPRLESEQTARWVCREGGTTLWLVLRNRDGRVVIGLEGHEHHKSDLSGICFIEARTLDDVRWILDRLSCAEQPAADPAAA
jgi:hypothetical protein